MIENGRRGPSVLLNNQLDIVEDRAEEILKEYLETDATRAGNHYANALDHIAAMQRQSQFSLLDNYSSSGLYNAFRDLLKDIALEQGYYNKLEYRTDRYNDSVLNLLRWFKLHSGGRLEHPPTIQYEFIIENFHEFRNKLTHEQSAQADADPVLQSMLVLLWRVVEDILEVWESLLSQGEYDALNSDVNLTSTEGDVGFIRKLWETGGIVTTYQQEESGPQAEFDIEDTQVKFFPAPGDLVRIEYADSVNERQYQYGNDNVPVSTLEPI